MRRRLGWQPVNDHRTVCAKRWLLVDLREDVAKCAANLIAICTVVLRQTWQDGVNRRCVPPFFCSLPPSQDSGNYVQINGMFRSINQGTYVRPAMPIVQRFVFSEHWQPSFRWLRTICTYKRKNVKRPKKKKRNCNEERLSFWTILVDHVFWQFWRLNAAALVVKNSAREISTQRKSWPWTVESQSRRFSRYLRRSSLLWTISGNLRARTIRHQTAPPTRITALQ